MNESNVSEILSSRDEDPSEVSVSNQPVLSPFTQDRYSSFTTAHSYTRSSPYSLNPLSASKANDKRSLARSDHFCFVPDSLENSASSQAGDDLETHDYLMQKGDDEGLNEVLANERHGVGYVPAPGFAYRPFVPLSVSPNIYSSDDVVIEKRPADQCDSHAELDFDLDIPPPKSGLLRGFTLPSRVSRASTPPHPVSQSSRTPVSSTQHRTPPIHGPAFPKPARRLPGLSSSPLSSPSLLVPRLCRPALTPLRDFVNQEAGSSDPLPVFSAQSIRWSPSHAMERPSSERSSLPQSEPTPCGPPSSQNLPQRAPEVEPRPVSYDSTVIAGPSLFDDDDDDDE